MNKILISLLIIFLVFTGLACQTPNSNSTSSSASLTDDELTEFAISVAEMKGHLNSSMAGLKIDDNTIAELHVEHPSEEGLVSKIEETLRIKDEGRANQLNDVFNDLATKASMGDKKAVKTAISELDKALHALVPQQKLDDVNFQSKVAAELFGTVKYIYTAGISETGEFVQAESDYQDTYGIYMEAKNIYKEIELNLDPSTTSEINALLLNLDEAFPSVNLTNKPMSPSKVGRYLSEIIKELG